MNQQPKPGDRVKQFLKSKDDIKNPLAEEKPISPEEAKEFVRRKLLEQPTEAKYIGMQLREKIKYKILDIPRYFSFLKTRRFKKVFYELFPVGAFLFFSCYIIWKMEKQFDQMKVKVQSTRSIKEIEIQKENEEIQRYLRGQTAEDEEEEKLQEIIENIKYKFEEDDENDVEDDGSEIFYEEEDDVHEKFLQDSLSRSPERRPGRPY
eukprot:TRINITY_DN12309_c0_g4_i1.p1 TRINITY_DN12309_c0_g4~~TRINITY_DN12309_c0_g4_i1.p1  ORF type:complete len:207 (-),score=78.74 TRINITY_DN12309_c0_g4_i1:103-723(-)